jgi:CRISPR-associated protein Csm1
VDNLGQIFSEGLGQKATLSRVASLSFALSLFFEGWVGRIAQSLNKDGRELIYSIYSGGDDLFFVGAWPQMPDLAERINQELHAYTGRHPAIHTSGGIALVPDKYPLYQAAEDALEAEHAAKANRLDGPKNALHFLGKIIPWARFGRVRHYRDMLQKLVAPEGKEEKPKVPRNLLHRLSQLYLVYEEARQAQAEQGQTGQVYWGPGQWRSAYSLARLAQRHKQAGEELKALQEDLRLENFSNIEWIGPAARWTELLLRKDGGNGDRGGDDD